MLGGVQLPCVLRATTSIVYVRLHGPDLGHLHAGCCPDKDLRWWVSRLHEWAADGNDVFVYVDKDGAGHAVRNADRLRDLLG